MPWAAAELLQLLYQTKTLSTAIFGVVILAKSLRCNQWCALSVLVVGVVLAQSSQSAGGAAAAAGEEVEEAVGLPAHRARAKPLHKQDTYSH